MIDDKSCDTSGSRSPGRPVSKIVCLGDSITWGYPYGPDYSWVGLAAEELALSLINRGINGETAEDLLGRFHQDVLNQNPSHLTIMIGANDASIDVSLQTYQHHIRNLIDLSTANDIVPILGLPVPSINRWVEYRIEKYRLWLKSYAHENGYLLLDFGPAMTAPDGTVNPECYSDEVHPSKIGYRYMAAVFKEFCRNSFDWS